jgi:alpha-L-fucosidase
MKKIENKGLKWFKEAKIGMFCHYGLYSMLGENENQIRSKVSKAEYRTLMTKFDAKDFNADEWVACAASMGAKYIVPTSRHAEGFTLWDSKLTKYKSTNTPFGRDIIAELAKACTNTDVQLSLYFNFETWLNEGKDIWNEMGLSYAEYIEGQLTELLTGYGPIGLIWFDHCSFKEIPFKRLQGIHALIKKLQPDCIVDDRGKRKVDPAIGDFITPEREFPTVDQSKELVIECCDAMGVNSWGYDKKGTFWSVPELASRVSKCSSQGHNYLLNVEPEPSGKIRLECIVRAKGLGEWIAANQDALKAKPCNIIPKDAGVPSQPSLGVCTQIDNKLYVHLHQWPTSDAILLPATGTVKLDEFSSEQTDNGILVKGLPSAPSDKIAPWIITIDFVEPPVALENQKMRVIEQDPAGTIYLAPDNAEIKTLNGIQIPKLNRYPDGRVSMGSLHRLEDTLTWNVKALENTDFEVYASFGSIKSQALAGFEMSSGSSTLKGTTWLTEDWSKPICKPIGKISVKKGESTVTLKVTDVSCGAFSDIHGIWLVSEK